MSVRCRVHTESLQTPNRVPGWAQNVYSGFWIYISPCETWRVFRRGWEKYYFIAIPKNMPATKAYKLRGKQGLRGNIWVAFIYPHVKYQEYNLELNIKPPSPQCYECLHKWIGMFLWCGWRWWEFCNSCKSCVSPNIGLFHVVWWTFVRIT